jgi:hypothetical protein
VVRSCPVSSTKWNLHLSLRRIYNSCSLSAIKFSFWRLLRRHICRDRWIGQRSRLSSRCDDRDATDVQRNHHHFLPSVVCVVPIELNSHTNFPVAHGNVIYVSLTEYSPDVAAPLFDNLSQGVEILAHPQHRRIFRF